MKIYFSFREIIFFVRPLKYANFHREYYPSCVTSCNEYTRPSVFLSIQSFVLSSKLNPMSLLKLLTVVSSLLTEARLYEFSRHLEYYLWYTLANSPISFWNRLNPTFTMAGHFFWHPTSAIGTTIPPNTEIWSVSGAICKIIDIFWRLEDAGTRQNKINFIFWIWKLATPQVTWNVFLTITQGNDLVFSITKPTSSTSERFNWTANLHVSM